jgi:uncharacterized SAM-binding protein YcdF (DUF218 family)
MFFVLTKTVGFFAAPSNAIMAIGILGLVLMVTRFARAGRRLLVLSFLLLLLVGATPLGFALLLPLEQRFPAWDASRGAPTGVIVLGGVINPEVSAARHTVALGEAAERVTIVADLARRYPDARIVFTSGSANLIFDGPPEADFATALFESFGVARDRIVIENQSRNTVENATLSKALVNPKPGERWLLVTSASHLPRAMGTFRQAGFPVEAYPVDYRTRGSEDLVPRPLDGLLGGFFPTETAMHEWIGLVAYRLTGRTAEFFPGPN